MQHKQIKADSILSKIVKKDSLFSGDYTVDPYKNCEFGCLYCDSSFDKTIYVKKNAAEILDEELSESRKGTVIVGSVHDPYQKIEKEFGLTREILKIIGKHSFNCHILTKSTLVKRDIDILSKMSNSRVTISLISLDKNITGVFEKNVPSPMKRLKTVKKLNENGIKTGVALIPILPFIVEKNLEDIIEEIKKYKAKYLVYKHLELKGDQKNCYLEVLKEFNQSLVEKYEKLYENSYKPTDEYIDKVKNKIESLCIKNKIKNKI